MNNSKIAKRVFAGAMAVAMMLNSSIAVFAASSNPKAIESKVSNDLYTYSKNGYVFEKVSHADVPTGQNDGWVDYYEYIDDNGKFVNGVVEHTYTSQDIQDMMDAHPEVDWTKIGVDQMVGDGCQSYTYSAVGYGDWVYMGSMYGGIGINASSFAALTGGDMDMATALVELFYNGEYYQEHLDNEGKSAATQGVVVKLNVVTGEMKILMSKSTNGLQPTMRGACMYNDKIYFLGAILQHVEGEEDAGSGGLPSIYEIDPHTDEVKCVYQATDSAGYLQMVQKGVFPTLRTIIEYKGSLIASVTDENGAHFIAFTPDENDFDEEGNFKGIPATNVVRNPEFKTIANQKEELFDYPAYLTMDSNYGGTVYQVIEYNGDLYTAINAGRASLGTAKNIDNGEDTGCYRGWALVRGHYDENKGPVDDASAWTWTPIVGNTGDDQWDGNDGAMYTFNVDPRRYAPGTCTLEVYNGYLYVGDYNDVTQATFGALGGIAGATTGTAGSGTSNSHPFRHLAYNLKQSINLYRFDKDMKVELVVGDKTEMFPDGSITGVGSGYDSHSNQYTAKAIVYDTDKTDDNDGILFYSTLDEGTILTPLGQIVNGEMVHMSSSEWMQKLERLMVVIRLLSAEGNAIANSVVEGYSVEPEEEISEIVNNELLPETEEVVEEIIEEAVEEAVSEEVEEITEEVVEEEVAEEVIEEVAEEVIEEVVEEKYDEALVEEPAEEFVMTKEIAEQIVNSVVGATMPMAYGLNEEEQGVNPVIEGIVEDIVNGTIDVLGSSMSDDLTEKADELSFSLADMSTMLDTTEVEEFAELYADAYDNYMDVRVDMPSALRSDFDKILDLLTKENLIDLSTCLYYLHDSIRGCDVYAITTSSEGEKTSLNMVTVTNNGMGDFNNHTMRNFAITDDYLMFLTGNPVRGAQSWRMVASPAYQAGPRRTYSHTVHHFDTIIEHKDPSCLTDGYDKYECTECEETKTEVLPMFGKHTPGKSVRENYVAATTKKSGGYDEVVYCSVCGEELSRQHYKIAKIHVNNDNVQIVNTGDTFNRSLYVGMLAMSALGMFFVGKKSREE